MVPSQKKKKADFAAAETGLLISAALLIQLRESPMDVLPRWGPQQVLTNGCGGGGGAGCSYGAGCGIRRRTRPGSFPTVEP